MKILIVDDNQDMLLTLKLYLERHGLNVRTCAEPRNCLALLRGEPADVLITDIFMPDVDGLQMIREVRAAWPDTAVIAMSGGGEVIHHDYLSVAQDLGADLVLRKPFDPEELVHGVRTVARRRESQAG